MANKGKQTTCGIKKHVTDRQTDRPTDRQTDRPTDRPTDRQMNLF